MSPDMPAPISPATQLFRLFQTPEITRTIALDARGAVHGEVHGEVHGAVHGAVRIMAEGIDLSLPCGTDAEVTVAVSKWHRAGGAFHLQGWAVCAAEGWPMAAIALSPMGPLTGDPQPLWLLRRQARPDMRALRGLAYDSLGFVVTAAPPQPIPQGAAHSVALVLITQAGRAVVKTLDVPEIPGSETQIDPIAPQGRR